MDAFTISLLSIVGVILLSIPVILVIGWRQHRARQRERRAYATAHGFSYTAKASLPAELKALSYFQNKVQANLFGRRTKNILQRTHDGLETLIFDFWYMQSTTNLPTSQTHRTTVVCFRHSSSAPWSVHPGYGLGYLNSTELDWFIDDSLKEFRTAQKKSTRHA